MEQVQEVLVQLVVLQEVIVQQDQQHVQHVQVEKQAVLEIHHVDQTVVIIIQE